MWMPTWPSGTRYELFSKAPVARREDSSADEHASTSANNGSVSLGHAEGGAATPSVPVNAATAVDAAAAELVRHCMVLIQF